MPVRRSQRRSWPLFKFDQTYRDRFGHVAGVDEAGRGPLAGPVVAAAVVLPSSCRISFLYDSKQLSPALRWALFGEIQRCALAIGVGIVSHEDIDRLNIYHASFLAMRLALSQLVLRPQHVLVDGFSIPQGPESQTGVIGGDGKSACVAAASVIAKVTRDCLMEKLGREYPQYGFAQHKGYGTPAHLEALHRHGPSPVHRQTFAPVRLSLPLVTV